MRSLSYLLIAAFVTASLSACVDEEREYGRRPAASGPARNHGQERREEVHERNAERKAEKEHKH